MDALLNLETVTSLHNLKGLRTLCDSIESHVRSLGSLGVSSASYGSLLSSILMNKLPHELRVIVSRKVGDEDWEFTEVMETIQKEIEARERELKQILAHFLLVRVVLVVVGLILLI